MGYMHIGNLYKNRAILAFKECWAMEKIHGTSAHIKYNNGVLTFFSGGEKHDRFVQLFDAPALTEKFAALGHDESIVFGEAYGGKCQGMSATYGTDLRFVAFDVKIGEQWLRVPDAAEVVAALGLEFVHYRLIPAELDAINEERDAPSEQARRNGIIGDRIREGVVLRPPFEVMDNYGNRVMAKHKRDEFRETTTKRPLDADQIAALDQADAIADEWVTEMRLTHVLDKFPGATIENTGDVIAAMVEDVKREAVGEIVVSDAAMRRVRGKTAKMFKQRLSEDALRA